MLRRLVVLLVAVAWAAGARAQGASASLALSEAVACLHPPVTARGRPDYPEEALRRKDAGLVRVELEFRGADQEPKVRVLTPLIASALLDAVIDHVKTLRVPCMPAVAEPVFIAQEFLFVPNDGRKVMPAQPSDQADPRRNAELRCLTSIQPGDKPEYPLLARQAGEEGNVLLRLRFASATAPPAVDVVAESRPRRRELLRSVERFAEGLRLPCMTQSPATVDLLFKFQLLGSERTVLRDLPLLPLLRAAEHVPRPAFFDTATMGCPFDLRLTYWQPHKPNLVREIEQTHPSRGPFLAWLADVKLRLTESDNIRVLGDEMTVSVPCAKIDL